MFDNLTIMKSMRLCATLILFATTTAGFRLAAQSTPTSTQSAPTTIRPVLIGPGPSHPGGQTLLRFSARRRWEKKCITSIMSPTRGRNYCKSRMSTLPAVAPLWAIGRIRLAGPGRPNRPCQFDTSRYGGGPPITKTIEVYSNAKNEPARPCCSENRSGSPLK